MSWFTIKCPYCHKRIPISSNRCPLCRTIIPFECGDKERAVIFLYAGVGIVLLLLLFIAGIGGLIWWWLE
jgi:hypothetical protein